MKSYHLCIKTFDFIVFNVYLFILLQLSYSFNHDFKHCVEPVFREWLSFLFPHFNGNYLSFSSFRFMLATAYCKLPILGWYRSHISIIFPTLLSIWYVRFLSKAFPHLMRCSEGFSSSQFIYWFMNIEPYLHF